MDRELIDLRSDVKTLPTEDMLEAMRRAELGDAKVNEDPTVLRLEAMAAERLGTEAAMLVISGTMANLAALMAHADPGDAMVLDPDCHIYFYEGAHARVAGLMPLLVGSRDGLMDPDQLDTVVRRHQGVSPRLLCLENTHNRGGGRVIPISLHAALCKVAHDHGMSIHVDGARIFNAVVASGTPAAEYARHVDSIMFCLSKSLCCPLGSLLCGSAEFIGKARLASRRLGGGMRQAGVIAAAGIVALDAMVDRLAEDHANARSLAEGVSEIAALSVNMETVESNMVNVGIERSGRPIAEWQNALKAEGVLIGSHRPDKLRFVTHRHISAEDIREVVKRIRQAANC